MPRWLQRADFSHGGAANRTASRQFDTRFGTQFAYSDGDGDGDGAQQQSRPSLVQIISRAGRNDGGRGGGGGGKFPEEENLLKATRLSEHRTFYELKNEASGMYCFVYSRHQKYSYIIGGSFPFDICVPGKERFNTGRDPFNQNSNRSDWEKWSTSKGGPVFSKLFRLDRTDPLSFGPNFPEILVEWIAPTICVENPEIPGTIQMERFIPVEMFRKKVIPFEVLPFSRSY